MSVQLYKLNEQEKVKFFNSVSEQLGIKNLQLYHPIYQIIDKSTCENNKNDDIIVKSKYRCTEILGKIEEGLDDEDIQVKEDDDLSEDDDEESKIVEINTDDENSDNNPDDDSDSDSDDDDEDEDEDEDEELLRQIEEELRLQNTYSIVAKVCHLKDGLYCDENEMRLFIKKSPLLEPIKVLMNMYTTEIDTSRLVPTDETNIETVDKIKSRHNCSHVEAAFLFLGSKLVENGMCHTFPYYYGCINGIDDDFHFDISDEYEELKSKTWFLQKVQDDYELIIVNMETGDEELIKNFSMKLNNNSDDDDDDESEEEDDDNDNENIQTQNPSNNNNKNIMDDLDELNMLSSEFSKLSITDSDTDIGAETGLKIDLLDDESDIDEDELYQVGGSKLKNDNENEDISLKEIMNVCEINDVDDISLSGLENDESCYFVKFPRMPVNLCIMEYMSETLDDILDDDYEMNNEEWLSILFQTTFGLAVANKHYKFVHNDLHSSNIMFQSTEDEYLYFKVEGTYFRLPLYGKITKIIDFARATFKINNRYVFSDVFDEEGEAYGQYSYPAPHDETLLHCEHKPNPSFDLGRLATTILERMEFDTDLEEVCGLVKSWTKRDDGVYIVDGPGTGFELYVDLGQECHNAVPSEVLKSKEFHKFIIGENEVPEGQYVYVL